MNQMFASYGLQKLGPYFFKSTSHLSWARVALRNDFKMLAIETQLFDKKNSQRRIEEIITDLMLCYPSSTPPPKHKNQPYKNIYECPVPK